LLSSFRNKIDKNVLKKVIGTKIISMRWISINYSSTTSRQVILLFVMFWKEILNYLLFGTHEIELTARDAYKIYCCSLILLFNLCSANCIHNYKQILLTNLSFKMIWSTDIAVNLNKLLRMILFGREKGWSLSSEWTKYSCTTALLCITDYGAFYHKTRP
jgi:hypothetical protein